MMRENPAKPKALRRAGTKVVQAQSGEAEDQEGRTKGDPDHGKAAKITS